MGPAGSLLAGAKGAEPGWDEPAILIDHIVKTYGAHRALSDLSFEIRSGEIFALLGPNGAGKTTTVEILEGYRRPDSGRVRVLGFDPTTGGDALKGRMGVMLQDGGLYPAITPAEALALFARFYANPRNPDELLELVGLAASARTRYRRLSGGQKQRLALALALIPNPAVVFLDEPTTGLDPQARRATWHIIRNLKEGGVTVLLTTHYLEEAERLADRIAIIDEGRLVALDTPAALIGADTSTVRVRTSSPIPPGSLEKLSAVRAVRSDLPGAYVLEAVHVPSVLVEVTTLLRDSGIVATEIRIGGGSLEDVFLRLTGKRLEQ